MMRTKRPASEALVGNACTPATGNDIHDNKDNDGDAKRIRTGSENIKADDMPPPSPRNVDHRGGTFALASASLVARPLKQGDANCTTLIGVQGDGTCSMDGSNHSGAELPRANKRPSINTVPPEVWARILEYSVHSDIFRLVKESDFIKKTVLPLLRFVYFDSEIGVSWSDAQKFAFDRVEEIAIDCMFGNVLDDERFSIPGWFRVRGFVEFLSGFKNLKHVLFGKGENETRIQILDRLGLDGNPANGYVYRAPKAVYTLHPFDPKDDHVVRLYEDLLEQFSQGYQQGLIPKGLLLHGLPSQHTSGTSPCVSLRTECRGIRCGVCQNLCQHFPLEQLSSLMATNGSNEYIPQKLGTVPVDSRIEWIEEREGGIDSILAKQEELWRGLLGNYETRRCFDNFGMYCDDVIMFEESVLDAMTKLEECGCDPTCIRIQNISPFCTRNIIQRQSYTRLLEIGFQLDESDFVAIL